MLQNSYDHLSVGLAMCETVMRTQIDEEPNKDVFELLLTSLELLDTCDAMSCYRVGLTMRLALASVMGFGIDPEFKPDGVEIKLSEIAWQTIQLSLNSMRNGMHSQFDKGLVPLDTNTKLELESFLQVYFSFHLDKRISTRSSEMLII